MAKKNVTDTDTSRATVLVPCEPGNQAFIPYWRKVSGKVTYGIDEYIVKGVCGSEYGWACRIIDDKGNMISGLDPNVDVFFSRKEAEKKLNSIKKAEDLKKMAKWEKKNK